MENKKADYLQKGGGYKDDGQQPAQPASCTQGSLFIREDMPGDLQQEAVPLLDLLGGVEERQEEGEVLQQVKEAEARLLLQKGKGIFEE